MTTVRVVRQNIKMLFALAYDNVEPTLHFALLVNS